MPYLQGLSGCTDVLCIHPSNGVEFDSRMWANNFKKSLVKHSKLLVVVYVLLKFVNLLRRRVDML